MINHQFSSFSSKLSIWPSALKSILLLPLLLGLSFVAQAQSPKPTRSPVVVRSTTTSTIATTTTTLPVQAPELNTWCDIGDGKCKPEEAFDDRPTKKGVGCYSEHDCHSKACTAEGKCVPGAIGISCSGKGEECLQLRCQDGKCRRGGTGKACLNDGAEDDCLAVACGPNNTCIPGGNGPTCVKGECPVSCPPDSTICTKKFVCMGTKCVPPENQFEAAPLDACGVDSDCNQPSCKAGKCSHSGINTYANQCSGGLTSCPSHTCVDGKCTVHGNGTAACDPTQNDEGQCFHYGCVRNESTGAFSCGKVNSPGVSSCIPNSLKNECPALVCDDYKKQCVFKSGVGSVGLGSCIGKIPGESCAGSEPAPVTTPKSSPTYDPPSAQY